MCRFAIDLSGELAIILSTDSDVKKGYFPFCFSFNRKLDRRLDIVHDCVRLGGFQNSFFKGVYPGDLGVLAVLPTTGTP